MAGAISRAQWMQEYATLSQVQAILDERDRLGRLNTALEAAALAALAVRTGPDLGAEQIGVVKVYIALRDWEALADALDVVYPTRRGSDAGET